MTIKEYRTPIIVHLGGWGRNWGDRAIQHSMQEPFKRVGYHIYSQDYQGLTLDNANRFPSDIYKALIVGGGGAIFHRPQDGSNSGWQFDATKEFLDELKIPLIIYGIGYNDFAYSSHPWWNPWDNLKLVQERADIFSVRSHGTKRVCIENGLDPDKIKVVPDPAINLEKLPIGISKLRDDKLKIGICWTSDRGEQTYGSKRREQVFLGELAKALNWLCSNENVQVVQIEHIKELDKDKASFFSVAVSEFISIEREMPFMYPPTYETAPYLAGIYDQMDLVLGMRGHSNIISADVGTAFIPMSSHPKNEWFMEEMQMKSSLYIDLKSANSYYHTNLRDIIREGLCKRDEIADNVKRNSERLKKANMEFNKEVLGILENGGTKYEE